MSTHLPILAALMIAGAAPYLPTLGHTFTFDDLPNITEVENIRMETIDRDSLRRAVYGRSPTRPVANLSFAMNYYLAKYDVRWYRATNIAIHTANALLVYWFVLLLYRVMRRSSSDSIEVAPSIDDGDVSSAPIFIAGATAAIWAMHPIQTQSVIYIVQRMNSLAVLFYLLALCCYLHARLAGNLPVRLGCGGAALIAFLLALGCKQHAAMLPLCIVMIEWTFFGGANMRWLKKNLPYCVAAVICIVVVAFVYIDGNPLDRIARSYNLREFTMTERVLTQFRVVVFYLSLLFYPHPGRFNMDHHFVFSTSAWSPIGTGPSILLITAMWIFLIWSRRRYRLIAFCLAWFFLHLAMESSVIGLELAFEHRTYLPSVGIVLLLVSVLTAGIGRPTQRHTLVACGLCVMLAAATAVRGKVWKTSYTLWQDCVTKSPNKARPLYSFGAELAKGGKYEEAIALYNRAIEASPTMPKAHDNLGLALVEVGRIEEGIEHHREAIRLDPKYIEAHVNLGVALARKGRYAEAASHYRTALYWRRNYYVARVNLGQALIMLGKPDKAEEHLAAATAIEPKRHEAFLYLGLVLALRGDSAGAQKNYAEASMNAGKLANRIINVGGRLNTAKHNDLAIRVYDEAIRLAPGSSRAYMRKAQTLTDIEQFEAAAEAYRKVIQLAPGRADAHYNLGLNYQKRGDLEAAIASYNAAATLDPNDPNFQNNLGAAYYQIDDMDKAILHYQAALTIDPTLAVTHYNIGMTYELKGDRRAAKRHYQKALTFRNDYAGPREALQRLKTKSSVAP